MHSLSMAASLTPLYTDITVTDPCEAEIAYTMLWLNPNIQFQLCNYPVVVPVFKAIGVIPQTIGLVNTTFYF